MDPIKQYFIDLQDTIDRIPSKSIQQTIQTLYQCRLNGRKVFIMGNGGSAATASHFVCDLAKNTRTMTMPDFKVVGLSDNMAIFSALANDEGYENVFAGQLASLLEPGDVVIGISTSGNSENILSGIRLANNLMATTIGFTGFDGGELAKLVEINLHVPSDTIEHVEDIHLILEHLICKRLREMAFEEATPSLRNHTVHSPRG